MRIQTVKLCQTLLILLLASFLMLPGCGGDGPSIVKEGDVVKVNYTLKLEDGTVYQTTEGEGPLEFTVGSGQMIHGFDAAVLGMKPGETKTIKLPPEEAYGQHRDDLVWEVSKDKLAAGIEPEVGMGLQFYTQDGQKVTCIVTAVSDNTITVDANHALVGKTLTFDIELVEIE